MSGQRASVENAGEKSLVLQNLPTDVLFVIFQFCDLRSLGRLSEVCRRFCAIISQDFLWLSMSKNALVTNQVTEDIQNRSLYHLSLKEKCRISYNWRRGKYKETVFFNYKTKYMPWLSLEMDICWLSKGSCIQAFERRGCGVLVHRPLMTLKGHTDDVCRFVSKHGLIISGGRDGAICGWSSHCGQFILCKRFSHTSDVNAVDYNGQVIVSGSRDKTVKVWNILEGNNCQPCYTLNIGDRVWSVAIEPEGDLLCCGSAGHRRVAPLHLYDLQRGMEIGCLGREYRDGAGILDLHWETPHVLLSCGYDTYIRLWDTRTSQCMASWEDPHDSVIYCLATDNMYTVLCGTSQHGRVQLWDKRMKSSVQMFYAQANHSSPVYSMAFDPCQLFIALDQSLNVLDFTGLRNNANGYM